MRRFLALLLLLMGALPAQPYSGRVKIADETLVQAKDAGIDYPAKLDRAIDGSADELRDFIRLIRQLDTSGAYFHYFHVYEVAGFAGDKKLRAALQGLGNAELKDLCAGLFEAESWLKPKKKFTKKFPETTAFLREVGALKIP